MAVETTALPKATASLRLRVQVNIAGKYRANPDPEAKDHDAGFAAAAD
jgi:hypothetical protein